MYKHDLESNNQQWLICHKIKPILLCAKKSTGSLKNVIQNMFTNLINIIDIYIYKEDLVKVTYYG